jgi:hypothetical protein
VGLLSSQSNVFVMRPPLGFCLRQYESPKAEIFGYEGTYLGLASAHIFPSIFLNFTSHSTKKVHSSLPQHHHNTQTDCAGEHHNHQVSAGAADY